MLRRAKPLLGTLVEVACAGHGEAREGPPATAAASDAAFAAVARIHRLMSRHEPGSDLSRFNAAAQGEWVSVDAQTACVFGFALRLGECTQGVFDVCAAAGGSSRDIELDAAKLRLRKHAPLFADLGGIAKGHAVDLAVDALRAAGMRCGWVNAGGDVRVFGDIELPLMVRSPRELSAAMPCTTLRDRAAATSARYLAADGPPHLVHGRTHEAIDSEESWTVAAPTCLVADALTKFVAATGDARHPLLSHYDAQAWIF